MGLLAQAITVFALAFGVCAWLLGRYFLSTSDMGVLREQLLASGETAALEEQQEAIAQARALALKPVLAPGSAPPVAPVAPAAAGAVASGDAPRKKKKKNGAAAGEDYGPPAAPGTTPDQAQVEAGSDDDEADDEDEDDDDGVDETAEPFKEAKVGILKFLEGSLSTYMKDGFQLDAISKFGCHLFLAGAAEAIGRENELDNKEFIKILETSVSLLGSSKDVVRKFGEKYDEYLLDPSYARMFKAGGDAMHRFIGDEGDAARELSDALEEFRKPGDKKTTGGPIAVMFTDIVGSTKLNQTLGDSEAQNVVRMHNTVVRAALKSHRGTEIKHTGDGIMASFASCPDAVESAVTMQKDLTRRRKKNPDIPLHIRIGVNAGEPIAEDGDLFGTTVQLAARICDKADNDGIFVSSVVRELSAGANVTFEDKGTFELKGVAEDPTLYGVALDD
jgi:class 3 adenylate cyclase